MRYLFPPKSRLLAALSGLLLAAACPPLDLFPLAWIGLVPLFYAIENPQGKGFGEGFIGGLVFNTGILYWLAFNNGTHWTVATLTMVAAVAILATGWGLAARLFFPIRRRFGFRAWLLVPFSWVAWEGWLSFLGELAFPWPLLALTQARFNALLQVMEFTGVFGVSFWVATLNTTLFILLLKRNKRDGIIGITALLILAAVPLFAHLHATGYDHLETDKAHVLLVQGSVPAHEKWVRGAEASWSRYDSLTRSGMIPEIDLIIWPETALPTHLMHQSAYANRLARLSDDTGAWIMTGASDYARMDDEYRPLNGAFLIGPGRGIVDRCGKRFLVPFGERVPFQAIVPQLGRLNFGQAEFLPGLLPSMFDVSNSRVSLRFPVMICYESIFPWISREAVQQGCNLLVTISNDAWYGRTSQPEQIGALSRFRCIETRRSMARVSNAGVSLAADHLGREIVRTRLFVPAVVSADLPLLDVETFYVKHGNLFLIIVTLIYGMMLLGAIRSKHVNL